MQNDTEFQIADHLISEIIDVAESIRRGRPTVGQSQGNRPSNLRGYAVDTLGTALAPCREQWKWPLGTPTECREFIEQRRPVPKPYHGVVFNAVAALVCLYDQREGWEPQVLGLLGLAAHDWLMEHSDSWRRQDILAIWPERSAA